METGVEGVFCPVPPVLRMLLLVIFFLPSVCIFVLDKAREGAPFYLFYIPLSAYSYPSISNLISK